MSDESSVVHYQMDARQSTFTVQAFAKGLLAGFGHNPMIAIRDFTGEVKFAPGTFADASMWLAIQTDSLHLLDDVKEKDRIEIERTMRQDILEISKYPEITFQSTNVTTTRIVEGRYKARIIGDLTMHGVTRNGLWIYSQFTVDENNLNARGDFTLKQTDYHIKLISVAGGMLKLKDELKFTFDIVAHKIEGE